MNPKFEAQETIDRAISNFDTLMFKYDLADVPLAQGFIMESRDEAMMKMDVEDVLSPVIT